MNEWRQVFFGPDSSTYAVGTLTLFTLGTMVSVGWLYSILKSYSDESDRKMSLHKLTLWNDLKARR